MGQTCHTIAFAVPYPDVGDDDALDDTFHDAVRSFKPMCGSIMHDSDLVGFELATGGSGHDKTIDMPAVVDLSPEGLRQHRGLAKMIDKSRKNWPKFVAHVERKTKGRVDISTWTPRLYLAMTETA